ncbi:hypothetical protein [Legionella sainthelensi]|nr:hypothetical protein [Legionella sainthelensi]
MSKSFTKPGLATRGVVWAHRKASRHLFWNGSTLRALKGTTHPDNSSF